LTPPAHTQGRFLGESIKHEIGKRFATVPVWDLELGFFFGFRASDFDLAAPPGPISHGLEVKPKNQSVPRNSADKGKGPADDRPGNL
jgi:hypothetical protein